MFLTVSLASSSVSPYNFKISLSLCESSINKKGLIFFSFDNQTSMEGIKTRLEAFYDMLKMKKEDYDNSLS